MTTLLGEYDIRIDAKSRIMLPSALKKQLPQTEQDSFVINRGFEQCLNLYPKKVWEKIASKLAGLNQYVAANREVTRFILNGATEVQLDDSGRLLIPKKLLEYAKVDKDIVMQASLDHVEIWAKEQFDKASKFDMKAMSALAEQVLGNNNDGGQTGGLS